MITRFNAMSMWAAASILWKQTIKERVALWVKLVNITEVWLAHSLFLVSNTLAAIVETK